MQVSTVASLCCCLVLVAVLAQHLLLLLHPSKSNKTYPPGPRPLPILGNSLFFSRLLRTNTTANLLALARTYGPLCMLWVGRQPMLIVSTAEAAKQLLDKRGAVYSNRPPVSPFRRQAFSQWRLVAVESGARVRLLRRLYDKLIGYHAARAVRRYQEYEALVLLGDLVLRPEGFLQAAERYSASVIFSVVYGVRVAGLEHAVMREIYAVVEMMSKYAQPGTLLIDYLPILERVLPKWLQPGYSFINSLRVRSMEVHRPFWQQMVKQVHAGTAPDCFAADLVRMLDDKNENKEDIDQDAAVDILAMLIDGGADTTSAFVQNAFKVLALHPAAAATAQAELDTVIGPNRLPAFTDMPSLPYTRALIKEIHRWAPIGDISPPHCPNADDYVNDGSFTIPKGTVVFPSVPALNRDPARYGPTVDEFRPERYYLQHDDNNLDAFASAHQPDWRRRDHANYGFGRRLCPGIHVAEASVFIIIARVLWAFDVRPPPHDDGKQQVVLDLHDRYEGLIRKPRPYQVSIVPRSEQARSVVMDTLERTRAELPDFEAVFDGQNV